MHFKLRGGLIILLSLFPVIATGGPCDHEAKSLCSGMNAPLEKLACLADQKDKLSSECQSELRRLNQMTKDTGARGGKGLQSFGGVMGGVGLLPPEKTIVSVEGMNAAEGRPTVINQGRLTIASPVWKKKGKSFVASLNTGTVKFNERVALPDGDKIGELHRLEVGGQFTLMSPDKTMKGFRATFGSAGDQPFSSSKEYIFSANAFYMPPGEDDSRWIYTVFISNNNSLLNYVPIPGFLYLYKNKKFTGLFGLPFLSLQWTPTEQWLCSVSFFITNFRSSLAYILQNKTQIAANFVISQQAFLRENREELRDRLFFADKRLFLSVRHPLADDVILEVQGGESFDRSLREGRRFNETDWRRDLGRSWYTSAALNLAF